MLGRRWWIVAVVLAIAACASEGGDAEVRSETPRVTTDGSRADLDPLLLTRPDVERATDLSVAVSDLGEVEMYENPDTRGPCGTPVAPLPTPDAGRGFTTPSVTIVELLYDGDEVTAYTDQVAADLRPGCSGYTSRTNYGVDQVVGPPTGLDLGAIGDRRTGWTAVITVGGRTIHVAGVVTGIGDRTALLQIFAADPVDTGAVVDLARAATGRLEG